MALIHLYIVYLEMVLWDTSCGDKPFGLKLDFATASKKLAANQELYKGFLAAGLMEPVAVWRRVPGEGVLPVLRRDCRVLWLSDCQLQDPLYLDRVGGTGAGSTLDWLVAKTTSAPKEQPRGG